MRIWGVENFRSSDERDDLARVLLRTRHCIVHAARTGDLSELVDLMPKMDELLAPFAIDD